MTEETQSPLPEQALLRPDRPGRPSAELRLFEDGPGHYRGLIVVHTLHHGTFAIRILFDRLTEDEAEAVSGALERLPAKRRRLGRLPRRLRRGSVEVGADPSPVESAVASATTKIVHPVLEAIQSVVDHPLAALAASASILVPGVGPAYLITYAIGQSLIDWAEKKTR